MRPLFPTAVIALCGMLVAVPAAAQSRVRTDVDTTLATVGDRITLTVSVEHPTGSIVSWPDSLDLSPFEVVAAELLPTATTEGRSSSTARIALSAFELGELEIPSIDVSVTGADGAVEVLTTDRFGIEVVTVGADDSGDIRGIRGPMTIAMSTLVMAAWALLLIALGAMLYAVLRRLLRKKDAPVASTPVVPERPAHEIALEALAWLEDSPMLERGQIKEYHIEASDILRRYVEARFGVAALEMTTWEIIEGLERREVGAEFRDGLRRFLDRCDLVKFAKVRPDPDEARSTLQAGRALVEATIPAVEEATV